MLPQVSLTVPLLPHVPDGSAVEMEAGKSGGTMQAVGVFASAAETLGLGGVTSSVTCEASNATSPDVAGTNGLFKEPANIAAMLSQTGLPIAGAAAEISPLTEQAVAAAIPATVGSQPEIGSLQRQPPDISSVASGGESGGTTAAMQRVIMKEQSPERQTRTVANVAVISSFQGKQRVADIPEKSSGTHSSESTPISSATAGLTFEPHAGSGALSDVPVTTEPKAASEITRQTFDLIERVRVTGQDNAEVRMLLNDGQRVTVSIRLERGEWKPVFKTESETLCRALEQNWNRAVAQPAPQSVKFGAPVFESHSAHSGLGSSSQEHPESGGRERSFNRREQEPAFENVLPFRAAANPARTSQVSRFSEAAAMQVYA